MSEIIEKISVNEFENAVMASYEPAVNVEWNGLHLSIKHHLSLGEAVTFVDICVKTCFGQDNVSYAPELKDVAIRSCIVGFYTNIALPEDVEKQYDMIYRSGILDVITSNVDHAQLNAIVNAIDDKIDYLTAANVELVNKQMNDLFNTLDGMQKKMSEMFSGIDVDDFKNVVGALSSGSINEEKLVKAYMANKK